MLEPRDQTNTPEKEDHAGTHLLKALFICGVGAGLMILILNHQPRMHILARDRTDAADQTATAPATISTAAAKPGRNWGGSNLLSDHELRNRLYVLDRLEAAEKILNARTYTERADAYCRDKVERSIALGNYRQNVEQCKGGLLEGPEKMPSDDEQRAEIEILKSRILDFDSGWDTRP